MVHHLNHHREYWFCRSCWQEMPDLSSIKEKDSHIKNRLVNLSISSVKVNQAFAM